MKTLNATRILPRFNTPIVVKRKATGSYVKGKYVPAAVESTINITNASVQPLRAKEMQLLPEGFRNRQAVRVFSPEALRTGDPDAGVEADRIEYAGATFEVHTVEDWSDHGSYWQVVAVKVGA